MHLLPATQTALFLLATCALLSLTSGLKLDFTDCGNNEVVELRSTTCEEDPCRVPIGGHVIIEVDFKPARDAKNVSIGVFASVFGFEVGLPLDDSDACAGGRLTCPVRKGHPQTLRYELKVKDSYYPVSGDVGFRLTNENDDPIACASISAELYTPDEHQEL